MDLEFIKQKLNRRDSKITSVCIAKFETQYNSIICIPENRSQFRSVAFIPKRFLSLEKDALVATLATTNIRYERA